MTKLDIVNNRLVPNAMEPRAALGVYDSGERAYTLWTTSQNPHVARLVISAFYNVAPENKLRVIAPDVGGGFGSKIFIYPEEIVCLWASKKTGVPVKWAADRTEAFLTDAHGRDHITHAEMAFDADNKMIGLKVDTIANFGAYMSLFSSSVPTYLYATLLSGQYVIPAIHCNVRAVYTNTTPVDAYRGAGRPEATFVLERLVETAARELGVSPAELRRKNFIRSFPYQTPVIMTYDAGDYEASLDAAMKAADYAGFGKRKLEAEKRGKLRGIGMSCYIEACGIAPSAAVGSLGAGVGLWESAEVRVNPIGTIEVLTGSHSHGQGHETTFAQLVSQRFGLPIENISIVHGDTDKVQFGMGTYGSRSGAVGMSAIFKALDKVEAKVKKIAAHLMEASEGDIEIANGEVQRRRHRQEASLGRRRLAAYTAHNLPAGMEPGLKEGAFYDPTNFTFPAGCYICEVEIDPQTGHTEIVQFVAADDFGKLINPMIVEGQVHGGIAQGVGQALLEGCHYDTANRPAHHRELQRLRHAARRRPAVLQGLDHGDRLPGQSARHQGLRRGRRHRLAAGGDQRDHRRARRQLDHHAGDGGESLAARPEGDHAPGGGIRERNDVPDHLSPAEEPCRSGEPLLQHRRRRLHLRRPHAAADHEGAARAARQPHRPPPRAGAEGHPGRRRQRHASARATTHARGAQSADVKKAIATLAALAGSIGDPQVRHLGTIGGSVANNDPAADYPSAVLALAGTVHTNKRQIAADEYFTGLYSTALQEGEIVTKIAFKVPAQSGYAKFRNPASKLSDGRRLRRQAQGRLGARGGDGSRQRRRLPLEGGRGCACRRTSPPTR